MSAVFAGIEDAFAANVLPSLLYVRLAGEPLEATEANAHHSVDRATGTCSVICEAPRPALLDLNVELEIEMGYPGAVRRVFHGTVDADESTTDGSGRHVRIQGRGWSSLLAYPEPGGIELPGPISLKAAFYALCALRSLPAPMADDTTTVDGESIMLGGNPDIHNGNVWIDDETAPLDWLRDVCEAYGYRVFDAPDGTFRLARVSGLARPQLSNPLLTTELSLGDYIQPRTGTNVRTGPGTAYGVLLTVTADDIGRVIATDRFSANGFVWMQVTFTGQPAGWCAVANTSGVPLFFRLTPDAVPVRFAEGMNTFSIGRSRELRGMETYIEVLGARYSAADGGTTEIRAIPEEVPYDPRLAPQGYVKGQVSSQEIVTDQQAQWVRNATEVDRAAPYELLTWEFAGRADLQPADVVTLHAPEYQGITEEDFWLMDIDQSVTGRGYRASYSGWRGGGRPLPAGNDCIEVAIGSGVYHIGTEHLNHYAKPAPDGKSKTIAITITDDDYSSLRVLGNAHGTNSVKRNTAITGSKVEIWQLEDPSLPESGANELKRAGSVDFPTFDEELPSKRPYKTQNRWWSDVSLPLPGRLKKGAAQLELISGEDKRAGGYDDYEVQNLRLRMCGVGQPILPGSVDDQ